MALLLLAAATAFLYTKTANSAVFPGGLKPTDPATLPPLNIFNPAANDTIRPRADQYDPRRIGYTVRANTRNVKGAYPGERRIGPEAADKANALHRRQIVQDTFVQQQGAYITDHFLLEPTYYKTGMKPYPRINSLGNPKYKSFPPRTSAPY